MTPPSYRLSNASIINGETYRSASFNAAGEAILGVTISCDQALSVTVAYGRSTATAAAEGTASSASLPFATAATAFASNDGASEKGTYHEIELPPMAQLCQLCFTNSSGSTATLRYCDWGLQDSEKGDC